MEDASRQHLLLQTLPRPRGIYKNNPRFIGEERKGENNSGDEAEEEEGDLEVWEILRRNFRLVQSVLDQNRALIQQVNKNHRSKIPDNLVKNVSLIQEINGNISKVISLYSNLSVDFSNIVHQRRELMGSKINRNSDNQQHRLQVNN